MKKLMITACAVAFAAAAQAAAISWDTGAVTYDGIGTAVAGGEKTIADGNWTYLFALGQDAKAAADYATLMSAGKIAFEAFALDNSNYDASTLTIGENVYNSMDAMQFSGGSIGLYDENDYNVGKVYAVVISTVEDNGKVIAYEASAVAAEVTAMGEQGGAGAALRWGEAGSTTGTTWMSTQAVPEPTSGLLLLLGVAGLALRRRRA